jgi:hypothetical protein
MDRPIGRLRCTSATASGWPSAISTARPFCAIPTSCRFPPLFVAAYALANRLGKPVVLAEPIVGAKWGVLILIPA